MLNLWKQVKYDWHFFGLVVSRIKSITEVYNDILSSLFQELQWNYHKEHIVPLSLKG